MGVFGGRTTTAAGLSVNQRRARERSQRIPDTELLNWIEATAMHVNGAVSDYRVNREPHAIGELLLHVDALHGLVTELATRSERLVSI